MIVNKTKTEMTALWLLLTRRETRRLDCQTRRSDAVDLEQLAQAEMRRWYLELLRHGPLEHVEITELAPTMAAAKIAASEQGVARITLGPEVVRVAALRLEGWGRTVAPVTFSPGAQAVAAAQSLYPQASARDIYRQASPFALAGPASPLVLALADGSLEVHGAPLPGAPVKIASLLAVIDTGEDLYRFDSAALPAPAPEAAFTDF